MTKKKKKKPKLGTWARMAYTATKGSSIQLVIDERDRQQNILKSLSALQHDRIA